MTQRRALPRQDKISPQFAARLGRIDPDRKVRAVVLLNGQRGLAKGSTKRVQRADRNQTMERVKRSGASALPYVDRILERYNGQWLSNPNVLSSISVEATPKGISALARSTHVKAILEDQPISLAR